MPTSLGSFRFLRDHYVDGQYIPAGETRTMYTPWVPTPEVEPMDATAVAAFYAQGPNFCRVIRTQFERAPVSGPVTYWKEIAVIEPPEPEPPPGPVESGFELREDLGFCLREDGGFQIFGEADGGGGGGGGGGHAGATLSLWKLLGLGAALPGIGANVGNLPE